MDAFVHMICSLFSRGYHSLFLLLELTVYFPHQYAHSTDWKAPTPEANTLLDFYTKIYTSSYPVAAAGTWVEKPNQPIISPEHLKCLDREFQGNCHSIESNLKRNSTAEYRHTIFNSPGILAANDQFTWQSNHPLYNVMPNDNVEEYRARLNDVLKSRTIFLIGDSLTRQWYQTMKCELMHVLGLSEKEVMEKIRWQRCTNELRRQRKEIQQKLADATVNDVLVFNFGHHVGLKNGENWKTKYEKILNDALSFDFGAIPDENIFFRTTSVRHFLRGYGDWDTDFTAGNTAPDMYAQWETYGGNMPEQPDQNLIAFSTLLKSSNHRHRSFQILDTSPLMLARGDATFDGSHFCLPGPVDMWSRMLYARLEAQTNSTIS